MQHIDLPHSLNRWLYLLVFLAGALSVFAFSPFELYPIVFFTPAILFYALSKARTQKQYFYLSWFFGIGLFGAGASWPFYSLYFFAHAPLAMALMGTLLFVVLVALFSTGLFGLLAAQFRYTPLYSRLLLFFPVSWVLIEWTRSWLFTGFPWLYFGNSLIDSVLSAYAPITGVLGVSLVSVLISGALVSFFLGDTVHNTVRVSHDLDDGKIVTNKKAIVEERFAHAFRIFSALLIVLLTSVAVTLEQINWTQKSAKAISVSVLQSNISQNEKLESGYNPEKLEWALNRYRKMTKESQTKYRSDLIVWPETGLFDTFNRHMDSFILPLQKSIKSNKSILIGGFYINQNNNVENSVLALSHDGREIYSKRHLVPFGEYVPFSKYIRWMGDWIPRSNLEAGNNNGTLTVAGEVAQMGICYEDAFGAEMIKALPEATMLINVTHDGWFTGSLESQQHMQIARMRSLETGRYMVRATTTGPSGIIDEKGRLVATAPLYTQKIITHKIQPYTGSTPYVRWGNWLIVSSSIFILLMGFLLSRNKYKEN